MVSVRTLWMMLWAGMTLAVLSCGFAARSNDRLVGQVEASETVVAHVDRDLWLDAARMGAPIYRSEGGPVSLPLAPAGKAIVVSGSGYVFATDDLAEVVRWYGLLTYPALDMTRFPAVRYVYEVESAQIVTGSDGHPVLALAVHEIRTGCIRPACDPVTQLPNYDRRYVIKPDNVVVSPLWGTHA